MQRIDPSQPLPKSTVRSMVVGVTMATVGVVLMVLLGVNPLILLLLPLLGVLVLVPILFRAAERNRQS